VKVLLVVLMLPFLILLRILQMVALRQAVAEPLEEKDHGMNDFNNCKSQ